MSAILGVLLIAACCVLPPVARRLRDSAGETGEVVHAGAEPWIRAAGFALGLTGAALLGGVPATGALVGVAHAATLVLAGVLVGRADLRHRDGATAAEPGGRHADRDTGGAR